MLFMDTITLMSSGMLFAMLAVILAVAPLIARGDADETAVLADASPAATDDDDSDQHLLVRGNKLSSSRSGDTVTMTVSDGATLTQGVATLTADTITLHGQGKDHQVIAASPLTFTLPDTLITADNVELDPGERVALFTHAVQMAATRRSPEMTLSADTLSLDYGTRQAYFAGHVTLRIDSYRIAFAGDVSYDMTAGRIESKGITISMV